MAIVTVGIDLAKNVFAVHGVDEFGKPALLRPTVPRAKLPERVGSSAGLGVFSVTAESSCSEEQRENLGLVQRGAVLPPPA